jgi:hypothetical protein
VKAVAPVIKIFDAPIFRGTSRLIADPAKECTAQQALAALLPVEVDVKMITTVGKEPNKSDESNESMRQRVTVIAGEHKQGASLPVGQINPKKLLELPIV